MLTRRRDRTILGHMETITISAFKARISEELRKVRKGSRIIIADRETPVAMVSPIESEPALKIRRAKSTFAPPPPPEAIAHDPLEYLLADRGEG